MDGRGATIERVKVDVCSAVLYFFFTCTHTHTQILTFFAMPIVGASLDSLA